MLPISALISMSGNPFTFKRLLPSSDKVRAVAKAGTARAQRVLRVARYLPCARAPYANVLTEVDAGVDGRACVVARGSGSRDASAPFLHLNATLHQVALRMHT